MENAKKDNKYTVVFMKIMDIIKTKEEGVIKMNNKIFIIEDEEKIRIELSELLNRYGYETRYSNDFENIVEIVLESNSLYIN